VAEDLLETLDRALRSGAVGSFTVWGDSMGIVIRSNKADGFRCVRARSLVEAAQQALEALGFRSESEVPNEAAGESPEPLKSGAADNQESEQQTQCDGTRAHRAPSVDGAKGPA